MKQLVATLLVALSFNALAAPSAVSLLTPSPLGIVIAVKTYLKDQKKVYYIRVESQAQDFEKAKKQAFRLASEQVAGTVVLSESELRNSKLTRDEIITYSSGLIDEYKIVDRFESLPELVENDLKSHSVDVVVFSPGGSSFDLFKNFEERGDVYKNLMSNHFKPSI
jgi:UDP-N-acetylmuramoylalanine-D-glutamate ligase